MGAVEKFLKREKNLSISDVVSKKKKINHELNNFFYLVLR